MNTELLPVKKVSDLEEEQGIPWLVEGLWMQQGVGFVGGNPKACKSWLALDLALSVASKTPMLGRYAISESGPVLLFAAEDAPSMVRSRLAGIALQRGLRLEDVPIHLVLASSLRLETADDQARLHATVARYRPKLVVLDPFVRLTRIDENSALEVSAVLGYLRELQRTFEVAILVVHHTRKSNGHGGPAGMALRGSGDFWAWGDTNLFLSRQHETLHLVVEHRSAATPKPVTLELCCDQPGGPYLSQCSAPTPPESTSKSQPLAGRILEALSTTEEPTRLDDLRATLRVRMQNLVDALRQLESESMVRRVAGGWGLAEPSSRSKGIGPSPTTNTPGETEAGNAEAQPAEG